MFNALLGLAGVALGTLNFFLLAHLAAYPVAQAVVFFVVVYIMGHVKAHSPQLLAISLLCILMTWNGIYTPLLTPNREFKLDYLLSYFESYCWGAAIAFSVNIIIFPHSAEKELRVALVEALENTKTFACLTEKSYRFSITEDEKKIRDNLAHSIQIDLNQLENKIQETLLEVNRSRWSLLEYKKMIQITKSMNRSLLTAHSSLIQVNQISSNTFHENFLQASRKDMESFRKYVYIALTEIQKGLAVESMLSSLEKNQCQWLENEIDKTAIQKYSSEMQMNQHAEQVPLFSPTANNDCEIHLRELSRLDPIDQRDSSPILLPRVQQFEDTHDTSQTLYQTPRDSCRITSPEPPNSDLSAISSHPACDPVSELINFSWQALQDMQHRRVNEILLFGSFTPKDNDNDGAISEKPPQSFNGSVQSLCETPTVESPSQSNSRRRDSVTTTPQASFMIDENQSDEANSESCDERTDDSTLGSSEEMSNIELYRSLIRASSYSFAMGTFVDHLIEMRGLVKDWNNLDSTKPYRIHFRFLQLHKAARSIETPSIVNILGDEQRIGYSPVTSDEQAFRILACNQRKPRKQTLISKIIAIEKFFRGADSIYASKMTCAITAIAILFWADKTRPFALEYGISSCILTVAVSVTPTLGQTWLSFFAQLTGQGFGSIYALIVIKLFSDVGGFRYNPYGLVVAMTIFAIPMAYVLYSKPHLFIMSLLAMNSAGQLVYIEYINQNRPYDSPALKLWKNMVCLAIAILVVTCVQMLVLRNPAKHTLRSSVAKLMKSNTSYVLLLNAYTKAIMNPDPACRPSHTSFLQVYDYLVETEERLQQDILALMPLLKFASAEPSFGKTGGTEIEYLNILRANQKILDRNREARIAVGFAPFSDLILEEFTEILKLHRQKASNQIISTFHLCTASLKAKLPLPPQEFGRLSTKQFILQMFYDTVALSAKLTQSPGGMAIFQEDELTRYWTYLLSINGILVELDNIRESCQKILGTLEATVELV